MEKPMIRKTFPTDAPPGSEKPFFLADPFRLTESELFLTEKEMRVIRLMNGERTPEDLARALRDDHGIETDSSEIVDLVRRLDDHLLLKNDRFHKAYEEAEEAFRKKPTRPMRHAVEGYPEDPAAFRQALQGWFDPPAGPGLPDFSKPGPRTTGLFAPHIDIPLAGPAYAHAYGPAVEDPANEIFVLLGTAHYRDVNLFILTDKDFETPFGTVRTDRAFCADLEKAFGADLRQDELIQEAEHSVEFQAVMLAALLQGRRPFTIVPLLVSSFAGRVEEGARPDTVPLVSDFLAAMDETLAPLRRNACIAAGVDLAHVGRKFGDAFDPTRETLRDLETADRRSLSLSCAGDAGGFWDDVMADGNARKVCGVAPMYVATRLLEGSRGEIKAYGCDYRPAQKYVVTFAGAVFRPA